MGMSHLGTCRACFFLRSQLQDIFAIAYSPRQFHTRVKEPRNRVNKDICSPEVFVISSDGEQLGAMDTSSALRLAENAGLDLVEVDSKANPPVCRVMDYGQFKYQISKRQHEAKKNQKIVHLKEIKLRPKIEEHDLQFKVKHAMHFIEQGDKVKITVQFRGREVTHRELGEQLMERFAHEMEEIATVEGEIKLERRTLSMVLAKGKGGKSSPPELLKKEPFTTQVKEPEPPQVEKEEPDTTQVKEPEPPQVEKEEPDTAQVKEPEPPQVEKEEPDTAQVKEPEPPQVEKEEPDTVQVKELEKEKSPEKSSEKSPE